MSSGNSGGEVGFHGILSHEGSMSDVFLESLSVFSLFCLICFT